MKTKAKMLWALFLAFVVNLVNTAITYMFGFFDGWPRMKDLLFYVIGSLLIWFWLAMLVMLDETIRKNKLKDAQVDVKK